MLLSYVLLIPTIATLLITLFRHKVYVCKTATASDDWFIQLVSFDHMLNSWLSYLSMSIMSFITFRFAMITFKCLHSLQPSYLTDVCTLVSSVVAGGSCGHAAYKDFNRSARLCCVRPRQHGTASPSKCGLRLCLLRHWLIDIRKKPQKSFIRLLAPLRTLSNWHYATYSFVHSFIHSFICTIQNSPTVS